MACISFEVQNYCNCIAELNSNVKMGHAIYVADLSICYLEFYAGTSLFLWKKHTKSF